MADKHPRTIILISAFFLLATSVSFGQDDREVQLIRQTVHSINTARNLKAKMLDNDYFTDKDGEAADNGREIKGYYQDGQLKKMVYSLGLSYCMKTFEYYFSGSELIFVFEKEEDYPEKSDKSGSPVGLDYSRLAPAFEARYYFKNGKIFQQKTKGKQRIQQDDKALFINNLKSFIADLKTAK
jgi:hypothetical protein